MRKPVAPPPDSATVGADVERLCLEADRRDAERLEREIAAQTLDWSEHQRAIIAATAGRFPGHDIDDIYAAIGEPGTDWSDAKLVKRVRLLCRGKRPGALRRVALPQDHDVEQETLNAARIARDKQIEANAAGDLAADDAEIGKQMASMGHALEPTTELHSLFQWIAARDALDERRKKSGPAPETADDDKE